MPAQARAGVDDYQPSPHNLRHYFRTDKFADGQPLPGLIGTHGYARFIFLIALLAEGVGLYALWGASQFNPMFAVFLFILDLGAALLAHASARGVCIKRNLRLVNDAINPLEMEDLVIQAQITQLSKFLTWLGRFLIVGLAVGKCIAMQAVRDGFGDGALPLFLTVIACYLVAALVHLFYTGDALFEYLRGLAKWNEGRRFMSAVRAGDRGAPGWPQTNVWPFESALPIKLTDFRAPDPYVFPVTLSRFGRKGQHRLVHTGEIRTKDEQGKEQVKYQYELITYSTLYDSDVLDLYRRVIGEHNTHTRNLLLKVCVAMQFIIFLQLADPRLVRNEQGMLPNVKF